MTSFLPRALALLWLLGCAAPLWAQDRDTKVRNDRQAFADSEAWVYNDLAEAQAAARRENKPLLVVLRCIPCEACAGFDDLVAHRDAKIAPLMDQFICVRLVQCNGLDLATFQHDFDMSFAAQIMHADGTIYGRFGTMSNHDDPQRELTLDGFAAALQGALALHKQYPANRESLAGKRPPAPRFAVPEKYPLLARFKDQLDYDGKVAQSCIHCHQVRDAEWDFVRTRNLPPTDALIYPWPMPGVVGLHFDRTQAARLAEVTPHSVAAQSGFLAGDELLSLNGQPLLSVADVQWVMHRADEPSTLTAVVRRGDEQQTLKLPLNAGWRREGDISWRATTWSLRAMVAGGMVLREIPAEERRAAGIGDDSLALRVRHLGAYDKHGAAKRAGFQANDILVAIGPLTRPMRETDVLAHLLRTTRPGEELAVSLVRDGKPLTLKLPMQ